MQYPLNIGTHNNIEQQHTATKHIIHPQRILKNK